MAKQGFDITATVGHTKNEYIRILDAADDDIPINGIAPSARS